MDFYLSQNQLLAKQSETNASLEDNVCLSEYPHFPYVQTIFDHTQDHSQAFLYNQAIACRLKQLLPKENLIEDLSFEQTKQVWEDLKTDFPLFRWIVSDPVQLTVSIYLVNTFCLSSGKFVYDMIHRWLLPGKKVNTSLFLGIDFRIPVFDDDIYTLFEIVVHLNDRTEFDIAIKNLPVLETEIRLGVSSVYHANKILEIKGLGVDEKTALIQEKIAYLLHIRPRNFDSDIFAEMQHFLVTGRPEFKASREVHQMTRLICYFYLMRKEIREQMEAQPEKRHLKFKLHFTRVHLPFGTKRVLSVLIAMNFLKENEIFEERHLLKALQRFIPRIQCVPNSLFIEQQREENILALYLEVTKNDGSDFTKEEIKQLRKELGEELKKRVQKLMRPVFMPRNEEEVMRNIITLRQELRYLKDIPQVIISFDEHTDTDVSFTIVMVRIVLPHTKSLQELFDLAKMDYTITLDRIKHVGTVWKKYPKEATVFRMRLPAHSFVRNDLSLDLFRARQAILTELQRIFGEVRDYNGGMISKQLEVFKQLQISLGDIASQEELLLENFFHSIFPVEQRNLLHPDSIKKIFTMFLELLEKEPCHDGKSHVSIHTDIKIIYTMLSLGGTNLKAKVCQSLHAAGFPPSLLPSITMQIADTMYVGFLFFSEEEEDRERFQTTIKQAIS